MKQKSLLKLVVGTAGMILIGAALIGFAHTPHGQPLLALLSGAPGCPVSLEQADPLKTEAFRVEQLEKRTGAAKARSPWALGFALGQTRRSEVERWLEGRAARCATKRQGSILSCQNVVVDDGPKADDLHLQFDERARLVAVDLFRAGGCGSDAVEQVLGTESRLERAVGAATGRVGDMKSSELDARMFHRAALEFRYRQYVAELSAMNYGRRGVRVRETYQWIPEDRVAFHRD